MYCSNNDNIDNIDIPDEFIEIASLLKLNKKQVKKQMVRIINDDYEEEQDESGKKITEIINYAVFLGGKYYRSFFINILGEALCVKKTIISFIATILELLHCQALMQNALPYMENEDYRYSNATCHKRFGNSETIIASNILISMIIEMIIENKEINYEVKCKIIAIITKHIGKNGINGGQMIKLMMKKKDNISHDEEIRMKKLKLNSLFIAGAECLELLAKTTEAQNKNIAIYILNFCNLMNMYKQIMKDKNHVQENLERIKLICDQGIKGIRKIKDSEKLVAFIRYYKYCIEKTTNEKQLNKPIIVSSDTDNN